jgi:copper chaperone CopZ
MARTARVELMLKGMSCGHCVAAVRKRLAGIPGVSAVEVTLDPPRAVATIDPDAVAPEALAAAATDEGYPATVAT